MEEDIQSIDSPVEDAAPSAPDTASPTEDKIAAEMSQTFDRIEARDGGSQRPNASRDRPSTAAAPLKSLEKSEEGSDSEALAPPSSLTGRTALDVWASTPREMQELVLQREREAQEKITSQGQELAELRRSGAIGGELASTLEHYKPNLPPQFAALPHVEQISRLYAVHERLNRDPVNSLYQLAEHYGVDLSQFGGNSNAGAQHQQAVQQLQHQVAQLHSQQQQQLQQRVTYLQKQVEDYAQDKAHWPSIEAEIGTQIVAIKNQNPSLAAVDPMAVLREAEKRALSITGVQDRQAVAEAKKKADAAKRLAQLNVKSSSGQSPKATGKNMYDEMRDIYDQINGRG